MKNMKTQQLVNKRNMHFTMNGTGSTSHLRTTSSVTNEQCHDKVQVDEAGCHCTEQPAANCCFTG
jgi:hypothetical protein